MKRRAPLLSLLARLGSWSMVSPLPILISKTFPVLIIIYILIISSYQPFPFLCPRFFRFVQNDSAPGSDVASPCAVFEIRYHPQGDWR